MRLFAALLLVAACDGPPPVTGSLTLRGAAGEQVFQPDRCAGGSTREFFGVDLLDGRGQEARVFEDPIWGKLFTLGAPESPSLTLSERSGCDIFDERLDFDPCGACGRYDTDQDDATYAGRIALDCATSGGGRVTGSVAFSICYDSEEQQ